MKNDSELIWEGYDKSLSAQLIDEGFTDWVKDTVLPWVKSNENIVKVAGGISLGIMMHFGIDALLATKAEEIITGHIQVPAGQHADDGDDSDDSDDPSMKSRPRVDDIVEYAISIMHSLRYTHHDYDIIKSFVNEKSSLATLTWNEYNMPRLNGVDAVNNTKDAAIIHKHIELNNKFLKSIKTTDSKVQHLIDAVSYETIDLTNLLTVSDRYAKNDIVKPKKV